jgi:hypothetical protein
VFTSAAAMAPGDGVAALLHQHNDVFFLDPYDEVAQVSSAAFSLASG